MSDKHHINIPVFIPHKGCPHTCVFCDQRKISGAIASLPPRDVGRIIEESLSTIRNFNNVEVAFFGGSFTGIPEEEMIAYLEAAKPYLDACRVQGIRLSTRPDYINPHILDILQEYAVTAIELGVQSLDAEVLEKSKRGHTVEDTIKACALIKERGISLGIQTMLGLPGDTFPKALKTAKSVVDLEPEMVRIYPAIILKNTELEELYQSGGYRPLSLEEAVSWCAEIVPLYKRAGIKILRLGLHSSETLEGSIIAGPYHPAFGELVESRIIYNRIKEELKTMNPKEGCEIIIKTRPEMLSRVIGHKRSNIDALKREFNLKSARVIPDMDCEKFAVEIPDH